MESNLPIILVVNLQITFSMVRKHRRVFREGKQRIQTNHPKLNEKHKYRWKTHHTNVWHFILIFMNSLFFLVNFCIHVELRNERNVWRTPTAYAQLRRKKSVHAKWKFKIFARSFVILFPFSYGIQLLNAQLWRADFSFESM